MPTATPSSMVPCTCVVLGDLIRPGLSMSQSETPAGVGLPQRMQ